MRYSEPVKGNNKKWLVYAQYLCSVMAEWLMQWQNDINCVWEGGRRREVKDHAHARRVPLRVAYPLATILSPVKLNRKSYAWWTSIIDRYWHTLHIERRDTNTFFLKQGQLLNEKKLSRLRTGCHSSLGARIVFLRTIWRSSAALEL